MRVSHQRKLMVFHWSLGDIKSPQVSRTLLSIMANLNNAVVWMVFTRPLIYKSPCLFINLVVTVPRAPITIGINVVCMFSSFFNFQPKSRYLSLFHLLSILFCGKLGQQQSQQFCKFSFYFVDYYKVWSSAEIRRSVSMLKSHRGLCVSFSRTDAGLCVCHLFVR